METTRTRRVGSMTFGLMLVIFGGLFLLHIVVPGLGYIVIFKLWPCIFILLGIEILVSSRRSEIEYKYDKAAIFLIIVLTAFAMCMAGADVMITAAQAAITDGAATFHLTI